VPDQKPIEEPHTNQGTAPFPPPGPTGVTPSGRADLPPAPPKSEPPIPEGGVSWEELRKGLPPTPITNPDQQLYAERFESQEQAIGQPNPAWRPAPQANPAHMPPDSPPRIEPPPQNKELAQGNQSSGGQQSKPAGS
jgi:hypothetical protein